MAAAHVGVRIAAARRRRGLSRKVVAELVGRSEEWLRLIETGQRSLDSIRCAIRLADVLRMPGLPAELGLRSRGPDQSGADSALVAPVRDALIESAAMRVLAGHPPVRKRPGQSLGSCAAHAWGHWLGDSRRYTRTFAVLPELIRSAATRRPEQERSEPGGALAAYHLAAAALTAAGATDLAWLAADRAWGATERPDRPELVAASAWHLSRCYLYQSDCGPAGRLTEAAAARLPRRGGGRPSIALRGALLATAAEAAAEMTDAHRAEHLLAQAQEAAGDLGANESIMHVPFGPVEVGISAVRIADRLGRSSEALRLAARLEIPDSYPPGLQISYFLQLACLQARRDEDISAVFALSKVAEISPEDLRYHPRARQLLQRLLNRRNQAVRKELAHLANLAAIT
jgi:DNA-binding XRE family transcriptional regulator